MNPGALLAPFLPLETTETAQTTERIYGFYDYAEF
jgi:hypothetical protein